MAIKTLLKAPLLTQSGYGVHSRQIFRALINDPVFDVYVDNLNWGHTSFLTEETKEKEQIIQCIQKRVVAKIQNQNDFDLFIHITIPNEFEKLGKINVGVTAGIETDRCSHVWVQKCNEMDLIIVPSEHSKKVLVDTTVEWQNPQTQQRGQFKLEKPIIVCNEGVDTSIFKKFPDEETVPSNKISNTKFEADFNFLHVGQWGKGGYGEDRKNVAYLVRYFIEQFKGRKDVGLVLKLNMARNSITDRNHTLNRLREIKRNFKEEDVPPIHLIHGNLTAEEMASLYNHPQIKSFISLTHGEGFGLPLLEAAACELPIIATNWSGHLDFLKPKKFSAVEYSLKEIPESAVWGDILIKGSRWAEVSEEAVKRRMQKMVSSYSTPKQWAKELGQIVKDEFDISVVCENFTDTVKMFINQQGGEKQLNPIEHLQSLIDTPEDYNIVYTMPMSTGDVFISTAVIDGLMKQVREKQPNAKLYFATQPQYFSVLEDNPNIHKVVAFNQAMLTVDMLEEVFDLVLTPNVATQYTFSNWVRRGQGRLLAEEFANHCHCELGEYFIKKEAFNSQELPVNYMTLHTGSGKGQWEARKYNDWKEIIFNLKKLYPEVSIVQLGAGDEPLVEGVDVDLRGKTNVHQLATILEKTQLHLSIDTFTMHLAAALERPLVALFGCSYATSTGPWVKDLSKARFLLLQSDRKTGCEEKACYKYRCAKSKTPDSPPINEIDAVQVTEACAALLDNGEHVKHQRIKGKFARNTEHKYERLYGKISGYTTTYNLKGYPFVESIKSMLGFCNEVVIVDGESTDGTYEVLQKLAAEDDRIKLYQNPWDFDEPGMDGMQKAFARVYCENEFLWQQDCDEVVHEDDYEKIKFITKKFPSGVDILHLPVIELWGNESTVTGRRHSWKWRMSRNKPEITHAINAQARLTDEKTGKIYAKQGMSDGCEYVNSMTFEPLPHTGFYNTQIEMARLHMPEEYANGINQIFNMYPSVFHYSWCSLENKVKQFKNKWDKQWNILYQTENVERFPDVKDSEVPALAKKLFEAGGEDSDPVKYKFKLERANPSVMKKWLSENPLCKDE